MFSHFSTIDACNRRADRHRVAAYAVLAASVTLHVKDQVCVCVCVCAAGFE